MMASPDAARPLAALFDLDGTLYDQPPLRRAMVKELVRSGLTSPFATTGALRRLRVFRRMREDLREVGFDEAITLDREQFARPARSLGVDAASVEGAVEDWMFERPLKHLGPCARPGLRDVLVSLRERGLTLGVFSDYPPAKKLEALGVADLFEVAIAATDPEINAFKPHPRGFEVGAQRLGHDPSDVVYIGDRPEVDGEGAIRAGMRCVIVRSSLATDHAQGHSESVGVPREPAVSPANGIDSATAIRFVAKFSDLPIAMGFERDHTQ